VSLATPAPDAARIEGLTVGGRAEGVAAPAPKAGYRLDVLASVGLVAVVFVIWLLF
jgi:hypothetical protein